MSQKEANGSAVPVIFTVYKKKGRKEEAVMTCKEHAQLTSLIHEMLNSQNDVYYRIECRLDLENLK